jgi:Raf kinase inhibitor-like YbhB/YbcL family protein
VVGSVVVGVFLLIASCGDSDTPDTPAGSSGTSGGPTADSAVEGSSSGNPVDASGTDSNADVATGPFVVTSTAYTNGQKIPTKYECSSNGPGMNLSPPLAWSGAPAGTQSYAIVMRDLDFQNGFIHWVIWDIPAGTQSLAENVEHVANPTTPAGAKQANFNGAITGYQGPCSPGGVNTYEITLYAIPTATVAGITPATAKAAAATAIVGAATATAKLAGES